MLHHLKAIMTPEEVEQVRMLAARARFVDGKITNPHSTVKENLQIAQDDALSEEPGKLVRAAMFRSPEVREIALPRQMARPTLALYEPGMHYGNHVDEAVFPSQPPMRADVSCTVFLSDPADYEGGELVIETGAGEVRLQGTPGDAVIYPSNTIHRVDPVTRGQRLVAIMWFQSMIRDPQKREILYRLKQVANSLHAAGDQGDTPTLVEAIRTNLLRMWAEI